MLREILLVGSVPLASAGQVFSTCARLLGNRVRRLPDGETGERSNWIMWQRKALAATQGLELLPQPPDRPGMTFRRRAGHVGPVVFQRLGFADAARHSWSEFQRLRAAGVICAGTRFQVSLPTPLAVVAQYLEPGSQPAVEPAYASAMEAELTGILAQVPPTELAVQWDIAVEFAILEGIRPVHFAPAFEGIIARLLRLAALVPHEVELGVHLCYGDSGHKHFKEPDSTALMVRVANALANGMSRRLDWIHMPVPSNRDDDAYFQPLQHLRLPHGCQLFLGLVHDVDGLDGIRRRIAVAERFAPHGFGIAAECGFGRRDPARIPQLLQLHVDA